MKDRQPTAISWDFPELSTQELRRLSEKAQILGFTVGVKLLYDRAGAYKGNRNSPAKRNSPQ